MNIDEILKRIEQLSKLCEQTEPSQEVMESTGKLFTQDLIDVDKMYLKVKENNYSRDERIDIMKECNWIWKKRLKIKEVGWDEYNHIDRKIEESLRGGRKIEAIKAYRKYKIDNDGDCSLKEAKENIDKMQVKLGLDY